ncbi:transcription factor bHLH113 [Olea europaea subsp. europaea]|uniref:Transcription factor bHLH113 n=1 Tax=Olea europaea subsp. europaea TaxID=158383 RepID=A0A8S0URN7_OLEEU|nr:transcription factor bHLH113 [Olea europaea subsp. europaea]
MASTGSDGFEDEDFNLNSFFSYENPPKMLCLGDYGKECDLKMVESSIKTAEKSGVTCSDSSSTSSTNYISETNTLLKSKKRNWPGCTESNLNSGVNTEALAGTQKYCKKTKSENSSVVTSNAKVKKEKLGERITALQQLVSPFGKTDTASVLHEAMGYIRFLQDQIQVLCSPYIHSLPEGKEIKGKCVTKTRNDLRSKGLCLVPVEFTLHVADSNGADFWSSATMYNLLSN